MLAFMSSMIHRRISWAGAILISGGALLAGLLVALL